MNNNINWELIKKRYPKDSLITGIVEHYAPFGIFIDIGDTEVKGIVAITDFLDEGIMTMSLYPPIGTKITCRIIGYTEDSRKQIWLSMKPSILKL